MRDTIKKMWMEYRAGKLDLITVGLATHTAIDVLEAQHDDLAPRIDACLGDDIGAMLRNLATTRNSSSKRRPSWIRAAARLANLECRSPSTLTTFSSSRAGTRCPPLFPKWYSSTTWAASLRFSTRTERIEPRWSPKSAPKPNSSTRSCAASRPWASCTRCLVSYYRKRVLDRFLCARRHDTLLLASSSEKRP